MKTQLTQSLSHLSTSNKVKQIIDSPQLPLLVESLSARSLSDLVLQVGVENSHAIVESASNDQIKGMLDIQLWDREPGKRDTLQVDEFYRWLETWNELGALFVVEKLTSLGVEFVSVCFMKHLVATDTRVVGLSVSGYDFSHFDVIPRGGFEEIQDESIWFVLLDSLQHLHELVPDFLESVLGRCSFVRSILREDISEQRVSDEINQDLSADRDSRSEEVGYITATDAFSFLSIAKSSTLEQVCTLVQYDLLTRRYFRVQEKNDSMRAAEEKRLTHGRETTQHDSSFAGDSPSVKPQMSKIESIDAQANEKAQLSVLREVLTELGINPSDNSRPKMLSRAGASDFTHNLLLDRALENLAEESVELVNLRQEEILYLANILVAGVGLRSRLFTEINAVKAVRATCNLGLDYLKHQMGLAEEEMHFELLAPEPGLLRVFHIGYRLLNQVPLNCAESLRVFLAGKRLSARLRRLPWISAQLDDLLPGERLLERVQASEFEGLKQDIDLLSLVIDTTGVHCLDHLIDSFPLFPCILSMRPQPIRLDRSTRFISSLKELEEIQEFVDNLQIDI